MSICVVTMVRNEADRYLGSALAAWRAFADEIIALDDSSTDSTHDMLAAAGARIVPGFDEAAWGVEWPARARLWDAALTSRCDWLLWLDADMVPAADPRDLEARDVDAIAYRLYDLWREDEHGRLWYRADGHWQAHNAPRIWQIRRPAAQAWDWNQRGLHCGHLPLNYRPARTLVAPIEYSLLHYGYVEALDKQAKRHAYCSRAQTLTPQEYAHADSITDDAYVAFTLPMEPAWPLTHASAAVAFSSGPAFAPQPISSRPIIVR